MKDGVCACDGTGFNLGVDNSPIKPVVLFQEDIMQVTILYID